VSWLWLAAAWAGQPQWRLITADHGLVSEHVDDLATGPDGALWIATHAGLYRWDGRRASRADDGQIDHEISRLVVDRNGVAIARDALGGGWRLEDGAVHRLLRDGVPAVIRDLAVDGDGEVRALLRDGLGRVDGEVVHLVPGPALPEGARLLRAGPDGAWIVGTREGFWRVPVAGEPTHLADAALAIDAEVAPDGTVWTVDNLAHVRQIDALGAVRTEMSIDARGMSLALRGEVAWVAVDTGLLQVHPDGRWALWAAREGVHTGGPVHVDPEGSLWLGTFRGLQQLPEPGAALWNRLDGLPLDAARDLELAAGRVWVTTWGGLGWVDLTTATAHTRPGHIIKNPVCVDDRGVAWTIGTEGHAGPARVLALGPGDAARAWPAPTASHFADGCARARDGAIWLTSDAGLLRAGGDDPPELVTPWPEGRSMPATRRVIEARDGAVWVGAGGQVCRWRPTAPWWCADLPGRAWVVDLVETEAGSLWVSDIDNGVTRLVGDRLTPIPGAAALPSRHILGLKPSPSGGTWVVGHGVLSRVIDRPDLPEGWEIVEALQPWLGHLSSGATDVVEGSDGHLWIAHNGGVTSVSAASRQRPTAAPTVSIAELRIDGTVVYGGAHALPGADAHVSVRYVASSMRAPSLVQHRVRIDGEPWQRSAEPGWLELRGLAAGEHTVELAASVDGERWTEPPTALQLTVPRPWYGRPEPWIALGALALLAALIGERLRSSLELRVAGLRTRIVLDLHDHLGAGLGAIGLLAGVVGHRDLPEEARAEAARRIAGTASDLGAALRGIVWSLRPDALYTDELGRWIAERARDLLGAVDLRVEISDQREPLDLDVLRAVQRIALESLHNAARHADARRVTLRLTPAPTGWELVVADDGCGFGDARSARVDGGAGLVGMRQRAAEIGATLTLQDTPGATVTLRFQPRRSRWRRA
jgi:signal transduction histidine kinase/ligand-binding sensor domain-containing protein